MVYNLLNYSTSITQIIHFLLFINHYYNIPQIKDEIVINAPNMMLEYRNILSVNFSAGAVLVIV